MYNVPVGWYCTDMIDHVPFIPIYLIKQRIAVIYLLDE
jgi:hypothetical protein